jgi:hypothetical protein
MRAFSFLNSPALAFDISSELVSRSAKEQSHMSTPGVIGKGVHSALLRARRGDVALMAVAVRTRRRTAELAPTAARRNSAALKRPLQLHPLHQDQPHRRLHVLRVSPLEAVAQARVLRRRRARAERQDGEHVSTGKVERAGQGDSRARHLDAIECCLNW